MSTPYSRPIITLHIGQAGIQIGHAIWELLCLEHNIHPDGGPKPECSGDHGNVDTVFLATSQGHFSPRSIFVDTDPFCVDEVRSGPYRGLFSSVQLLSDQVDAGTNYATGRYGFAKVLLPETIDRLRGLIEKSDVKPTICLMHSACGGTGGGFAAACLSRAADELGLPAQTTLDLCLVPGRMAVQNSCELLNAALYLNETQSMVRQTFCVSNSALFRVCTAQLHSGEQATYAHVNRILATAFSNLTATERLPGSTVSLYSILDSLLPFEHLKYPQIACAPYLTTESALVDQPTVKGITAAILEPGSQFLDVDPRKGRHAAGFLLYRGAATISEIHKQAAELTQTGRVKFHDWVPAGFRTGVIVPPPISPSGSGFVGPSVSVTMVTSHSGISGAFSGFATAAKRLHEADLFVHSYERALVSMLNKDGSSTDRRTSSGSNAASATTQEAPDYSSALLTSWMALPLAAAGKRQNRPPLGRTLNLRACAVSDVFGVRVRLSTAIAYLERIVLLYAENADPGSNNEMATINIDALTNSFNRIVRQDDGRTDDISEESLIDESRLLDDEPAGHSVAATAEVESEDTVRWYETLESKEDSDEASQQQQEQQQRQQQQQSQNQQSDTDCLSGSTTSSSSNSVSRHRITRRFGCLRHGRCRRAIKTHHLNLPDRFSWSPTRLQDGCQAEDVIKEAERA